MRFHCESLATYQCMLTQLPGIFYIFTFIYHYFIPNFLIPQLYLDTEYNSCSVKYKMMKVPTCLVFPQLSASISDFQLQTFPIVPCGLNRTWFKPVMLE